MSRWFRHYAGMMRDDKLVRVAIRSKQTIERVSWVWGAILESAAEIDDAGRYDLDAAEAAYFLRADEADVVGILRELEVAGRTSDSCVVKWGNRQFQSDRSAERVARHRAKKRQDNVGDDLGNDGVTLQERPCNAPETETETETELDTELEKTETKVSFGELVDLVVSAWNAMAIANGLSQVRVMDASRRQSLRLREKSVGLAGLLEAIDIIGRSDWLKGEGRSNNWRPTIDFILQPESLRKVLEGSYGGAEKQLEKPRPLKPEEIPNAIRFWRDQGNTQRVAELEAQLAEIRAQRVAA